MLNILLEMSCFTQATWLLKSGITSLKPSLCKIKQAHLFILSVLKHKSTINRIMKGIWLLYHEMCDVPTVFYILYNSNTDHYNLENTSSTEGFSFSSLD